MDRISHAVTFRHPVPEKHTKDFKLKKHSRISSLYPTFIDTTKHIFCLDCSFLLAVFTTSCPRDRRNQEALAESQPGT